MLGIGFGGVAAVAAETSLVVVIAVVAVVLAFAVAGIVLVAQLEEDGSPQEGMLGVPLVGEAAILLKALIVDFSRPLVCYHQSTHQEFWSNW